MATMQDIVTRAYQKIGVVAVDEQPEGAESVLGLGELNDMLSEWELRGVDLTYTALTASDTFPLDAKFNSGTIYMLASRLSSDFMRPQSFDADDFFRNIQAAYMVIGVSAMPEALKRTTSRRTGSWVSGF